LQISAEALQLRGSVRSGIGEALELRQRAGTYEMDAGLAAALGGAIGAAIGAVGSNVAMLLQTRTAARTERTKQIVQLAIEDLKLALEQARHDTRQGGTFHVAPLAARLQYHEAVLSAIEEKGKLDIPTLQQIRKMSQEIDEVTRTPP
jgi:hypothetical protein